MDTELPGILRQFVKIAGREEWKKRFRWLEREVRRETGLRHFWHERCPLELGFSRSWRQLRKTGQIPFDTADEDGRRFLSFAAMTVRCHQRLTPTGRKRLAGMLRSATKGDFGLGPVAYEMKIATHLLGLDYDVVFHDLEGGRGYDLLAAKDGMTLEVECTHMSGDAGRKIHRKELYRFADRFSPWMRDHLGNLTTSLFARLTIPGRLESADAYQKPLCTLVGRALLGGGTDLEQDGARVRVEAFDVERVAGPWNARHDFGRAAMEARLLSHFDLVNKNAMVYFRPGRSVVVLLIVSEQQDQVLNGMHAELRKKTKDQFTGGHPAILCCHLADLTSAQLISLARSIDPCYDDWFEFTDVARFTSRSKQLLIEQILPTDLELPSSVSFADCDILSIGKAVAYGERHVVLDHENFDEAMRPIRDPLKRLFLKPSDHQSIKEYRIAFVITDNDRRAISVKTQPKDIQLMPSDPILSTVAIAA